MPDLEGVPKSVSAVTADNGMVRGLAALAFIGGGEATVVQQDPQKQPGNCGSPVPWFDDAAGSQRGHPNPRC